MSELVFVDWVRKWLRILDDPTKTGGEKMFLLQKDFEELLGEDYTKD